MMFSIFDIVGPLDLSVEVRDTPFGGPPHLCGKDGKLGCTYSWTSAQCGWVT